ncbi:MAG: iron-containing alcohol dehydrogenase [Acidobacteriota bacterium]|nr:iron-containing alcohol dehydrogenase [Acidobacteriota bacterium]
MNNPISVFSFPTRTVFGAGALARLGDEISGLGMRRPLLVTDRGVVEAGIIERVKAAAKSVSFEVFDKVSPNPTEENVLDGIEAYRQGNCDGVVAIGGGSPLDAAKAIRMGATHPLPLEQYDDQLNGGEKITANMPAMAAVATTSGTGSEVGRSAVILLKSTDRKTVIFSPHLIPSVALDDPELTLGMPPKVTAGTGLDALTHNIEAYLAKGYHPMCDAIALSGTRLAVSNLARAVHQGMDIEARSNMMMASLMGAVAFQKGLGVTHSLAHPLSSIGGLHHGTTNGVLLPYVLEFNRPFSEDRLRDLAVAMGLDVARKPAREAADAAIDRIRTLLQEVGVPDHLSALGIRREMIPAMSKKAMEDACHLLNPRPCAESDMTALYESAL